MRVHGCVLHFEAAFPSIEHGFLLRLLRHFGWPEWLLRFASALYQNNYCDIALQGARCRGFELTRGVRQGCPLSPLLFTVASDLLLCRIRRLAPGALERAYADDLVIVVFRALENMPTLHSIFAEYALISGLKLNFQKTVIVPLFDYDAMDLRAEISRRAPAWGAMAIRDKAIYLGLVLGPGAKENSWEAPIRQYAGSSRNLGEDRSRPLSYL